MDDSAPKQPDGQTPVSTPASPSETVASPQPVAQVEPVSLNPLPESSPVVPPPPATPPTPMSSSGEGQKKSRSLIPIIIGLIVLLIAGLAFAFYYFNVKLSQQNVTKVPVGPTAMPFVPIKNLKIGTDATYPPMETQDAKGMLSGYDIDLGTQLAKELGGKAEFKNIAWDDVFKALEEKKIDVIISSVTITDERKKQYLFSSPYINAGQVILTKKDNVKIATVADLVNKKVGVQKDTTSEKEAVKYADAKMITGYADYDLAAKDLVNGKLDAVIIDLTAGKGLVDKYRGLKIASDSFTNEYYGIVLRKDDVALQSRINQAISTLHERGVLDDIKQKWFQ
jgi:polar amino acid transport system substrate-binding protein